jgi:hypothetical protein
MPRKIDIKSTGSPRHGFDSLQLWAYNKLAEVNPSMETPGLIFDEKEHAYTLESVPLVSVTQIIKHFLNPYYPDETAKLRGIYVHQLCEQFITEGNINWTGIKFGTKDKKATPDVIPYMMAFRDWYNQQRIDQLYHESEILCETPLASAVLGFAGKIDIIVPEQTGIFNLYLKPDGKFDFIPRDREKYWNWNLFSSMLNVYKCQKREKVI